MIFVVFGDRFREEPFACGSEESNVAIKVRGKPIELNSA